MELDALSGARLALPPFDLNKDGTFDQQDMVSMVSGGQNRLAPPSGLESSQGILPRATILAAGGTELQYNSGSDGSVMVTTENPGPGAVGRQAWQQIYQ
jgi:type IV pilus assembly protein PilY1